MIEPYVLLLFVLVGIPLALFYGMWIGHLIITRAEKWGWFKL